MKKLTVILLLVVSLGFVSLEVAAQGATPEADQIVHSFISVPSDEVPGHLVYIVRFTLQPGGVVAAHSHPGTTILTIEQGSLGYTLLKGTAQVFRVDGTSSESVTEPNSDIILDAGDTVFYESDVVHNAWTAGDAPVTVHATHILKDGLPLSIPAGTPEAHTANPIAPSTDWPRPGQIPARSFRRGFS